MARDPGQRVTRVGDGVTGSLAAQNCRGIRRGGSRERYTLVRRPTTHVRAVATSHVWEASGMIGLTVARGGGRASTLMLELLIARDPIPGGRLPFLLSVPVAGEAPLVLACAAIWPGAKDVFFHPLPFWPPDAQLLETLPVEQCWWAGHGLAGSDRTGRGRRAHSRGWAQGTALPTGGRGGTGRGRRGLMLPTVRVNHGGCGIGQPRDRRRFSWGSGSSTLRT